MKHRTVLAVLIAILLAATPAIAHEFGFGGGVVDGHSDSGDYSMSNGGNDDWALMLHYDHDAEWFKQLTKNVKIGLDPGMTYIYARWTIGLNYKSDECISRPICTPYCQTCPPVECRYEEICKTKEHTDYEMMNSHILGAYGKVYLELFEKVRLFHISGAGVEFIDDTDTYNLALMLGGGLQYRFTDDIALSFTALNVWADPFDEYRRYDLAVLSVDWLF